MERGIHRKDVDLKTCSAVPINYVFSNNDCAGSDDRGVPNRDCEEYSAADEWLGLW